MVARLRADCIGRAFRPAIERTAILWEPDVRGAAGARIGVRRWDAGRP